MEESRPALEKQGLKLAAVSYDSVAILKDFGTRRKIGFPLLSDEGSKVIKTWGVLNTTLPASSPVYGVPFPVTFVLDQNGKVTSKHFEPDYRERETVAAILSQQMNVRTGLAETTAETKHLKVTASASNATVRPLQHVRLRMDIELKPKMHVYAPGVQGYKPIGWTIKESPLFRVADAEYPDPRMLHLKAIGETVPVYENTFSVSREIILAAKPPMGEFAVEGELLYQACDDKVCYVPQRVPVEWKLRLEPLDTERPPKAIQHRLN